MNRERLRRRSCPSLRVCVHILMWVGQKENDGLRLLNALNRTSNIPRKGDFGSNLGIPSVNIDFH